MATIPTYTMQCLKLPLVVLEDLEHMSGKFSWGDDDQSRSVHTVSWEFYVKTRMMED